MKRRKICVITATRAEYGLLFWLMKDIKSDRSLILQVVVAGSHISKKFGLTYKQIEKDGFNINEKVRSIFYINGKISAIRSISGSIIGFDRAFKNLKPDIIVMLGDRYEVFAAAVAAYASHIPIAHIHGGEVTAGVLDDAFRHSITKMAYLHFPSIKSYADRIIRMGESPKRVFSVGALGIDNIKKLDLLSKADLEEDLGIKFNEKTAVITYHPETLGKESSGEHLSELLGALDNFDMNLVFTSAGADPGSEIINCLIMRYVNKNPRRAKFFTSLGQVRYLSLLKYADVMVGNSSSGIIEAASFHLPVVNIGDRQKQRQRGINVIDCKAAKGDIIYAVNRALSGRFRKMISKEKNIFGDGRSATRIKSVLKRVSLDAELLKKEFYE